MSISKILMMAGALQIRKIYPEASVAVSEGTFSWDLANGNTAESTAHVAGLPSESKSKQKEIFSTKSKTLGNLQHGSALEDEEGKGKLAKILKNINMVASRGKLTAIIGPVGSGKSSLLQAILGEMEVCMCSLQNCSKTFTKL